MPGRLLRCLAVASDDGLSGFWPCEGGFDEFFGVFGGPVSSLSRDSSTALRDSWSATRGSAPGTRADHAAGRRRPPAVRRSGPGPPARWWGGAGRGRVGGAGRGVKKLWGGVLVDQGRVQKVPVANARVLVVSAALNGGRSSMVEPQIVVLAVAGSSPVGHPELI